MKYSNEAILLQEVSYNANEGTFFVIGTGKQVIPDIDGFCWHYSKLGTENNKTKTIKIKANRLACLLGFGKAVRKDQRILHRNLIESDCRLRNLQVIPRKLYLVIEEARVNLDSKLRLVAHPNDQFSYFLHYRSEGRDKRELILDIVIAKKRLNKLQLKYSKILSKYCLFEELT